MLGERGKYGHFSYFQDEELLRVPLYVKFPAKAKPSQKTGSYVSLAEVSTIITSVIQSSKHNIGSDVVYSESFGSQEDLSTYTDEPPRAAKLSCLYRTRVKIHARHGRLIYNVSKGVVEEIEGELSESAMNELVRSVQGVNSFVPVISEAPFTETDEETILGRHKDLGYA